MYAVHTHLILDGGAVLRERGEVRRAVVVGVYEGALGEELVAACARNCGKRVTRLRAQETGRAPAALDVPAFEQRWSRRAWAVVAGLPAAG